MLTPVLDRITKNSDAALKRMSRWLAIPSVSTDPAYGGHVARAAEWTADELRAVGMKVTIHRTDGHPVVFAQSPAGDGAPGRPGAPTLLFYGHYDVQPPDPLELWETPPFEPSVRDGAIHARGASDDKGQVCCFLESLRAWREAHGKLPVRVKVVIEGEEECGSTNMADFVAAHRELLAADVAAISDTTMWDAETPAITYGLRGLLYFDIKLHGPDRDLHSGMYGGVLANPATILAGVLGRLFDDQRRVTVPGFYDDVEPLGDDERAAWAELGFDEHRHCLGPVGVDTPCGEAGFSTLERKWARPSCDVCGLYGGYGGEGAKTVIPSFAGAKVNFRLAANQDPLRIARDFQAWLEAQQTWGCRWEVTDLGHAYPVLVDRASPYVAAATRAYEAGTGRRAVLMREGATIPVVADFKTALGLDTLLMGFGLNDDRIHSPNEKFDLKCFDWGCRTHAALLAELGGSD